MRSVGRLGGSFVIPHGRPVLNDHPPRRERGRANPSGSPGRDRPAGRSPSLVQGDTGFLPPLKRAGFRPKTSMSDPDTARGRYIIDRSRSRVGFQIRLIAWKVPGEFTDFEGTIDYNESRPEAMTAEVSIRVASIDTKEEKRDKHLRSLDFFGAGWFPTMRFVGERASVLGSGRLRLEGDLTMREVTRPASFEVRDLTTRQDTRHDGSGRKRLTFTARSTINRMEFVVGGRNLLDRGGLMIGRDVEITLQIQAVQEGS
jgi:polyisoprenoid-binding protein YceI